MKKIIVPILSLMIMSFCATDSFAARIPIRWGNVEKITKVADLPQDSTTMTDDGKYFSLGYKYTVYEVVWMPLYFSDKGKVVGYINDKTFVDLSEAEVKEIAAKQKLDLGAIGKAPFWDRFGGKIVLGIVIFLILYGIFSKDDDKKEEAPARNI